MIARALLLFCFAGALPAQELKLVPAPRSVARGQGTLALRSPVLIALASSLAEDRFAAGLLVEDWKSIHGLECSVGSAGTVLIGRPGEPRVEREIVRRKLDVSALDHEES
ncbi:MAG: hypothetical protein Q8N47_13270, partial [Bryobacterales bacterium]|nr:hypothetical protein [Bryobacterales bacterium]